ncbi:MAG: 50S ribosomal protein L30 [Euryarchaeota archaeon]|nr:50S ribosomal protein L30 [Euryarchaeota archaeon]
MIAAIRIRGSAGIKKDIQDTMVLLKLNRVNHAVLIKENPSYQGMLQKAKDYITWGEIDQDTLTQLIRKRGELAGGREVTDDHIKENTDYFSIEQFSKALLDSKAELKDARIKPVSRLHPPRKGYKNIKKTYKEGGSLGYREDDINNLIKMMI